MTDHDYMRRALQLAELGLGNVSPNPMVGCVIVHDGKIIGEGYHQKYGEAHAEVNAINAVKDHDVLRESTVYVTLEPCAHHGKTPPCANLLVEKHIKRIVIAQNDPFEHVDGKGIAILRNAGIAVEVGIFEREAKELNKRFLTFHEKKRPYVILKWAQTIDGYIARPDYDSKWISNEYSRQLVHKWRSEEDAILVGKNTAKYDDPELTVRTWNGRNPIRILIDKDLKIPPTGKIFNDASKTIIINTKKEEISGHLHWVKMEHIHPEAVLSKLHALKIQSVIIEGGGKVLNDFIVANCWDEARVFESEVDFKVGIPAPKLTIGFKNQSKILNDTLRIYRNG